jgi:hypothetical protein
MIPKMRDLLVLEECHHLDSMELLLLVSTALHPLVVNTARHHRVNMELHLQDSMVLHLQANMAVVDMASNRLSKDTGEEEDINQLQVDDDIKTMVFICTLNSQWNSLRWHVLKPQNSKQCIFISYQ